MARISPELVPFSPAISTYRRRTANTGGWYEDVSSTKDMTALGWNYNRSYSGTVTSNFRELARQRKALPIRAYSSIRTSYTSSSRQKGYELSEKVGSQWISGYRQIETWTTAFDPVPYFPTAGHDAYVATVATARASKEASGVSVNLAEAFAERKQTAHMISSTITRIASAARRLRRGDLFGAVEALGTTNRLSRRRAAQIINTPASQRLSNFWLELQYGWKPLLQDVHDSAELLARHIATDPYHSRITGTARAQRLITDFSKADPGVSHGTEQSITSVRVVLNVKLDSQCQQILSQTGISNPALLAWELLPYSFVVDWFIPVGNYLEALTAWDGWIFQSGFVSTHTDMRYNRSWTKNAPYDIPPYRGVFYDSGFARAESHAFKREILTGFPSAQFGRLKSLDEGLSLTHTLNGLALLGSFFGRR